MRKCSGLLCALTLSSCFAIAVAPVPVYPPGPISFYDRDTHAGQLGGIVEFPRAFSEADITRYDLYFGSSATQRMILLVSLPQTGIDPEYDIPMDTPVPSIGATTATHFLAFSVNNDGEHMPAVSFAFNDRATPVQGPAGIDFWDADYDRGQIGGHVTIQHAISEVDVDQYMLYFGAGQLQTAFVSSFSKTGSLVHNFPNNTAIPAGATHLLAFTVNSDGFTMFPAMLALVDHGLPTETAIEVSFTDSDLVQGEVSGIVMLGMAASEEFLTHYAIYFGSSAVGPRAVLVGLAPVTGANVSFLIPADTPLPQGVTHLIVFGRNGDGESTAVVSTPVLDRFIPVNKAFSLAFFDEDIDSSEVGGLVAISPAIDESDVDTYILYFSDALQNSLLQIDQVTKGSPELNYSLPLGTAVPNGATHLLVKTGNQDGIMATGVSIVLEDRAVPLHQPSNIEFSDQDLDGGQISGVITVTRAASEADITFYKVYYGTASLATSGVALSAEETWTATLAGLSTNYAIFYIGAHTPIPLQATHLLAFSGNIVGEIRAGISTTIIDRTDDFPTVSATGLQFVDFDLDEGEVTGAFIWSTPGDTTGLTHYNAYIAEDEHGTNRQLLPGGGNMPITQTVLTIPLHTSLGIFTHLLVYAHNTYGEGPGAACLIIDRALPVAVVSSVAFQDQDQGVGVVGGTVTWSAPANPSNPASFTGYAVYFASDLVGSNKTKLGDTAEGTNFLNVPHGTDVASSLLSYVIVHTQNAMGEAVAGANVLLVDLSLPVHVVLELQFLDQDLGIGELGGTLSWTEPLDTSGVDFYRAYFVESNSGLRVKLGETPVGSSDIPLIFNTPLLNFTNIVVVTVNAVGESLLNASIEIRDHTAENCPTEFGHSFSSSSWRVVAGSSVSKAWRLRAIRFYEDPFCTKQVPAIPDKWPRRPRQTQGAPFANPPAPDYLHDLFRAPVQKGTSWANGTELVADPDAGPWWSTGMPCLKPNATDHEFPEGSSRCYVGFNWESDSFIVAGRVHGSSGTLETSQKTVHCTEVEQAKEDGGFATMLALQWYNPDRAAFQTLMQRPVSSGGFAQLSYQRVVAAECALQGR